MPLISRLDFVSQGGLRVSYQCTEAPQDVTIHLTNAALPVKGVMNWYFQNVADVVHRGAAGSDVFPPWSGLGEVIQGPRSDADAMALDHRAVLRLGGVAPVFLRTIVEEMRHSGVPSPTTSVTIVGSVPLDGGPLSVRESHVAAWLDDPTAYPRAWAPSEVPIQFHDVYDGCQIRLELEDVIDPTLREKLEHLCFYWLNAIRNVVSYDGQEVVMNPATMFPVFGHGRREFRAHFEQLPYAREPARATLANMIGRFHRLEAKIVAAEVSL